MTAEIDFDSPIERVGTGCEKYDRRLRTFGREDVIPLWVADMDFAAPACAREALANRITHPIYGYHTAPDSLFEAFCGWHERRHHWRIDPAHVIWSSGTVPILAVAVLALTEPGDSILVPSPIYPPFFANVEHNGRRLITSPLILADDIYQMDFDHLEHHASAGAKMLLLCSPHNPVGRVWSSEELERLIEIAVRHQMIIVSDEVHADLVYPGHHHTPFALRAPEELRLVTAVSQAKTFNMPGMGLSAAVASNPADYATIRDAFERMHLSPYNPLTMAVYEAAYRHSDTWVDGLMVYLDANRRWLFDALSDLDDLTPHMPEATFLMWIDARQMGKNDAELQQFFVEHAGLGLSPGHLFGPGGSGHMRVNFGTQKAVLHEAINRLVRALEA